MPVPGIETPLRTGLSLGQQKVKDGFSSDEHSNPASAWWVESWSTGSIHDRPPKIGGNRPAKHIMAVYEKTKMEKTVRRVYTVSYTHLTLPTKA